MVLGYNSAAEQFNIGAVNRISNFDATQNVKSWLKKFELACELDGVLAEEKTHLLKVMLSEDVLKSVEDQGFNKESDYHVISRFLLESYSDCESSCVSHNQFFVANQSTSEPIRAFGL